MASSRLVFNYGTRTHDFPLFPPVLFCLEPVVFTGTTCLTSLIVSEVKLVSFMFLSLLAKLRETPLTHVKMAKKESMLSRRGTLMEMFR